MSSRSSNVSTERNGRLSSPETEVLSDKCMALLTKASAMIDAGTSEETQPKQPKRKNRKSRAKVVKAPVETSEPVDSNGLPIIDQSLSDEELIKKYCQPFTIDIQPILNIDEYPIYDPSVVEQEKKMDVQKQDEQPKQPRKRATKENNQENVAPKRKRAPRAPKQKKEVKAVEMVQQVVVQPQVEKPAIIYRAPVNEDDCQIIHQVAALPAQMPIYNFGDLDLDDDTENVINPNLMVSAYGGQRPEALFNDLRFYSDYHADNQGYNNAYQEVEYNFFDL